MLADGEIHFRRNDKKVFGLLISKSLDLGAKMGESRPIKTGNRAHGVV
jgi:hypothetical protein